MPLPLIPTNRRTVLLGLFAVAGCTVRPETVAAAGTVYAVSNGWHVGLAVARTDLPDGLWPEVLDLPPSAFLQVGWGDRVYYPAPQPTVAMAMQAALRPGPSVLHLIPLARTPRSQPGVEVLAVPADVAALAAAVDASFDRPQRGPAAPVAPGLYPGSLFYPARGRFHLFNTCNTWAARKLAAGGVALEPGPVIGAEDLMRRLRRSAAPG